MVGTTAGGSNKNLSLQTKGVGGRSSPTVPRILSPKKSTGHITQSQASSSASNQISKDIARSLFKDCVNKSENDSFDPSENEIDQSNDKAGTVSELRIPTTQTIKPVILNNDPIAINAAEKMTNDSKSGFQSSTSNVMSLSIANGKIKEASLERTSIPDKSKGLKTEEGKDDIGKKSSILMDLLKPLDGKNLDYIEEESSSVLSSCSLKLTTNELGLIEFNGKESITELSDSDDSDSIDLTCQENPPSSPSPKKDGEKSDRTNNRHKETIKRPNRKHFIDL